MYLRRIKSRSRKRRSENCLSAVNRIDAQPRTTHLSADDKSDTSHTVKLVGSLPQNKNNTKTIIERSYITDKRDASVATWPFEQFTRNHIHCVPTNERC